jgi:transaldolase
VGTDGLGLIEEVMEIFEAQGIETEVIAASIRNPIHVIKAASLGCDIATVPFSVIIQMLTHPLTAIGIERFLKDWEGFKKK